MFMRVSKIRQILSHQKKMFQKEAVPKNLINSCDLEKMRPIGLADAWWWEPMATRADPLKMDAPCLVYSRQVRASQQ